MSPSQRRLQAHSILNYLFLSPLTTSLIFKPTALLYNKQIILSLCWSLPIYKIVSGKSLGGESSLKTDFKPLDRSPHFAPTSAFSIFQTRNPMITYLFIALLLGPFE